MPTTFPTELLLPARGASLGEILDAGFTLYRRSLIGCLPLSLVAVLLGQLPSVYLLGTGQSLSLATPKDAVWWVLMTLAAVGTLWCWLSLMLRQRAALLRTLLRTQESTPGTTANSLVTDLLFALRILPTALATLALAVLSVALGLVLLVIPGLYLLVAFWPALALVVFEGAGARSALDGALQLVRGSWRHLAATLVIVIVTMMGLFVVGGLIGLVFIELVGYLPTSSLAASIVTAILAALFQPLPLAWSLAAYADLRHRRDQIPSSASSSA